LQRYAFYANQQKIQTSFWEVFRKRRQIFYQFIPSIFYVRPRPVFPLLTSSMVPAPLTSITFILMSSVTDAARDYLNGQGLHQARQFPPNLLIATQHFAT
jgi:hypothetical protein